MMSQQYQEAARQSELNPETVHYLNVAPGHVGWLVNCQRCCFLQIFLPDRSEPAEHIPTPLQTR